MIGLIVPPAAGDVPPEAGWMYPGTRFAAKGLGLGQMSAEGFAGVDDRIIPAARELVAEGAEALSVMGTSLSFYRGAAFDRALSDRIARETGRPATTMAQAILRAMRGCEMSRVTVLTAYRDDVNDLLRAYLEEAGIEVLALRSLDIRDIAAVHRVTADEILPEARAACAAAPSADGLLISCGGLPMADVAPQMRRRLPVVSSAEAGIWDALRLIDPDLAGPAQDCFGPRATADT